MNAGIARDDGQRKSETVEDINRAIDQRLAMEEEKRALQLGAMKFDNVMVRIKTQDTRSLVDTLNTETMAESCVFTLAE